MKPKIITLPDDLVSKIAAGEVIERPASCIKELVENSIDAQAQRISIEIKGNGVPEMRVSDDGIGMTSEELELAVKPHTTSKLTDEKGLYEITNFGFRGEAFSSICRVADVEITSKTAEQDAGGYVNVKDEKIFEVREGARAAGTTVTARNLFHSIPARRKFLKSATAELRYITFVVHRLALACPGISFTLTHDDHKILSLPQQSLPQRIGELFGADFLDSLGRIEHENSGTRVSGYLSKPYNLTTRPRQFTFVNSRPCRDGMIRRAIEQAYGVPLKDRSPSYVFFVDLPPESVDVNVHPRKEEVRFRDENLIYSTVIKGVRDGLGIKTSLLDENQGSSEFNIEGANFWQFYDSYIFAETVDGILILDQHAAHERIMYERVVREKTVSQKLLFPILLDLDEIEQKLLREFKGSFEELGFEIEEFGGDTWRLTAVPSILRGLSPDSFISMLLELAEYRQLNEDRLKQATRVVACKSAIKAGQKLAQEEIEPLVKSLFATGNPYFCPHGRPTIMKFTRAELERKFGK